jgi:hypothetical protein
MLGFNGGRIGVANTTSAGSASGMWSSLEVVKAVRDFEFPQYIKSASGGNNVYDISVSGINYRVHEFTTVGVSTFTVTDGYGEVEYLIVGAGAGGGGGWQGGGGGAGGLVTNVGVSPFTILPGSYTVTVGAGGTGCRKTGTNNPTNGGNSSIGVVGITTAIGGGRGASENPNNAADSGGSGGGGAHFVGTTGASGTSGQGNSGGNGLSTGSEFSGGGGGGAGGAGTTATSGVATPAGGIGLSNDITGTSITYAVGGDGRNRNNPATGADGTNNRGNGGSGGSSGSGIGIGGNGGSGIVIIRYKI